MQSARPSGVSRLLMAFLKRPPRPKLRGCPQTERCPCFFMAAILDSASTFAAWRGSHRRGPCGRPGRGLYGPRMKPRLLASNGPLGSLFVGQELVPLLLRRTRRFHPIMMIDCVSGSARNISEDIDMLRNPWRTGVRRDTNTLSGSLPRPRSALVCFTASR